MGVRNARPGLSQSGRSRRQNGIRIGTGIDRLRGDVAGATQGPLLLGPLIERAQRRLHDRRRTAGTVFPDRIVDGTLDAVPAVGLGQKTLQPRRTVIGQCRSCTGQQRQHMASEKDDRTVGVPCQFPKLPD